MGLRPPGPVHIHWFMYLFRDGSPLRKSLNWLGCWPPSVAWAVQSAEITDVRHRACVPCWILGYVPLGEVGKKRKTKTRKLHLLSEGHENFQGPQMTNYEKVRFAKDSLDFINNYCPPVSLLPALSKTHIFPRADTATYPRGPKNCSGKGRGWGTGAARKSPKSHCRDHGAAEIVKLGAFARKPARTLSKSKKFWSLRLSFRLEI